MKIVKRDGHIVDYCPDKIESAISKANAEVAEEDQVTDIQIRNIIKYIEGLHKKRMLVEDIQDIIEIRLMALGKYNLAKQYITYRYTRELVRRSNTTDRSIKELIDGKNEYWNNEISNKNAKVVTTQRDYLAGITSTDITRRFLLTEDIVQAHDDGIIHFHDADYFAQNALHNCDLINLDDMLQNGTNVNGVMIEKPHKFLTAMTIATQIITSVTSSQYGGATITLTHLAPFVRSSKEKYEKLYKERKLTKEQIDRFVSEDLHKEIVDGVQTFQYQINSMTNTNGQAPFLSVCMYLGETDEYKEELAMIIEEFLNQRILGMKNEKGVYITPVFPKLVYVLEEDNINPDSKYYYLTELALKCSSMRMSPDYISEKVMLEVNKNEFGEGNCYPCMGSRTFLTPDRSISLGNIAKAKNYVENKGKYYGRFNQGIVTINLPDIALSSNKDMNEFFEIFNDRIELCHKALQIRHKRLSKVTSDVAPILWQYGALARLEKGESIHELLHHGYSTISLGYAGLYECVKYMTGHSHTDNGEGHEFALKIMNYLNEICAKWNSEEDIDYVVYGTASKSISYRFAKCLREKFGKIKGITDRDYITDSYHVPVFEEDDIFAKLKIESEFQKLSPGGATSYVEISDVEDDKDKVMELINFIYNNMMYVEVNTKNDYCQKNGFSGELIIDDDLD
ncbi:MAG: anaerobic ribonucleoside-triphosphate reductase [Bacilli bacterium]|nr:anaerobic ribonucleoside-triphosphate reductase [Bacilli bacterium]